MDRSAAERLVKKDLDETTGLGKPISSRARLAQRTVEAYLKAGVRPRWMERIAEIDHVDRRPEAPAGALAPGAARGVRRTTARCSPSAGRAFAQPLPLRRAQRADPPAQRVVPDRARPADGPAHARLRADQRPLVPARRCSAPSGCWSSSRPSELADQAIRWSGSCSSLSAPSVLLDDREAVRLVERDRVRCCAGRPTARAARAAACACAQQRAPEALAVVAGIDVEVVDLARRRARGTPTTAPSGSATVTPPRCHHARRRTRGPRRPVCRIGRYGSECCARGLEDRRDRPVRRRLARVAAAWR